MTPTTKSSSGLRLCPGLDRVPGASEQRGVGEVERAHGIDCHLKMAPAAMSIRLATSEAVPRPPPKKGAESGWSVVPEWEPFEPLSCVDLAQVQSGIRGHRDGRQSFRSN